MNYVMLQRWSLAMAGAFLFELIANNSMSPVEFAFYLVFIPPGLWLYDKAVSYIANKVKNR